MLRPTAPRAAVLAAVLAAPLLAGGCSSAGRTASPVEATRQDAVTQQGAQAAPGTTADQAQDAATRQGSGGAGY